MENDEPPTEEVPEKSRRTKIILRILHILLHIILIAYFIWSTVAYVRFERTDKECTEPIKNTTNTTNATDTDLNNSTNSNSSSTSEFTPNLLCQINWCTGYGFFIVLFVVFYIFWIYYFLFKPNIGQKIYEKTIEPHTDKWNKFSQAIVVKVICLVLVIIFAATIVAIESIKDISKLNGVIGPVIFILLGYIFSSSRKDINWGVVVRGIFLQFLLGIICLRLKYSREFFECAGNRVTRFLQFTSHGARFVYGERICDDFVFAFAILAVIFFFSVITSVLYFLGVMQPFLRVAGWLLQSLIGTTVCESVNASANIFLGMTESPLVIRPFMKLLTFSEFHTVCVSGYCTVAGSVLGAYISFGASPAYLIAASVMAAPGSLGLSKLFVPETEESLTTSKNIQMVASEDKSILDAASSGASAGIAIVIGIVANIIAFVSIIAFFNGVVEWTFELVNIEGITFIWITAQIFVPITFAMGVPWRDCNHVAKVVAEKSIINEFVGYMSLGKLIRGNKIEARSAGIATFAVCGFANPSSMGILIAGLSAMAPSKRSVIIKSAFRGYFVGSLVSFISASFAGLLIQSDELNAVAQKMLEMENVQPKDVGDYLFQA